MEGNSSRRHLNCSNVYTVHDGAIPMATTFSSREFNQDTDRAKKAASHGTVFINDRGHLSYGLLTVEEYQRLTKGQASSGELLAMPIADAVKFYPPRMADEILKPSDFS